MLGVDYSARSVELAKQIATARREESDGAQEESINVVEFTEWDVLSGPWFTTLNGEQETNGGWDIVLDKGTFDAICLSEEKDAHGRRICEGYGDRVLRLVRPGGLFLVTSCNWTEAELKSWFENNAGNGNGDTENLGRFVQVGRVQYRSFSFGGIQGQTISSVCFQRRL
jgi:EEF1A lysine methyltransferase 2